jgi:hypothetical protein
MLMPTNKPMQEKMPVNQRKHPRRSIFLRQSKKLRMTLQIWKLSKTWLNHLKSRKRTSRQLKLKRNRLWELRKTFKMPSPHTPPPRSVNNKTNGPKLKKWLRKRSLKTSFRKNRNCKRSSRKKKNKIKKRKRKKRIKRSKKSK